MSYKMSHQQDTQLYICEKKIDLWDVHINYTALPQTKNKLQRVYARGLHEKLNCC